jgi:hypothetical protein
MDTSQFSDVLMTRKQAAEYLGRICLTSLDRLPIKRTRIRRRVFFKKSVLDTFLEENTQGKELKP